MLEKKWKKHDVKKDGYLDIKGLSAFIRETQVNMTRNELTAAFLALDKNFDDRVSYQELLK